MGLMDKIKGMVNPDIGDNYDDDYVFDGEDENDNASGYEDDYSEYPKTASRRGRGSQQRPSVNGQQQQYNQQEVSLR